MTSLLPTPRPDIYDLYWIFAARRQAAFERRLAGHSKPWTDDVILQQFKFCNVFRASDRVSQYLIRRVAYCERGDSVADRIFQIVAFRTFSKPETWEGLIDRLSHPPTLEDLRSGAFQSALDEVKIENGGLYTGAFILCATKAFGFNEKHKNHAALFKMMFLQCDAAMHIQEARSFAQIVQFLQSFPLMGPFMSYQIAIDLNYSDVINFGENDYSQAGPGAIRGIKKAFINTGSYSPSDIIHMMVERQQDEFRRLGLEFSGLWGRPLHAIDCQGLFCELDKYCREAAPQLASNRSRIKARFTPSRSPLDLFFPPKWKINERIPNSAGLTAPHRRPHARQLSLL
ncbi:MAG: nucleotide kinase domain-containing protein [Thermoanaerobaculia bacterium]